MTKFLLMTALFFATALFVSAQVKTPSPPPKKVPFAESLQAIVVTTPDWTATQGRARLFERKDLKAKWAAVGDEFPVVVGRNGLGWSRDSAPEDAINNAPTLRPVFKAYCSAMVRKDEVALRKIYSSATLRDFTREMVDEGSKSLVEYLSVDHVSNEFCEISNEKISADKASAEIRTPGIPNGTKVLFVKENGSWKLTNRSPELERFKREGDGKAPAGMFPLTFAFGSGTKPEAVSVPYTRLEQNTECVDDVNSTHYNKVVDRMKVGNFDWKSSEKMLAVGAEYELGIFVAHNSYSVRKGDGSCIFLHIWKDAASPTSGCTAMERSKLERILTWVEPKSNPYLVQLPEKEYENLSKAWGLPKLR